VAFFHAVPLTYGLMGDANLTNLFAQQVGLTTMAAVILWRFAGRAVAPTVGLMTLASAAFLSHVSTFGLLLVTLLASAALMRLFSHVERVAARAVAVAAIAAAVLAFTIYYAHFDEVYARLAAFAGTASPVSSAVAAPGHGVAPGRAQRTLDAMTLTWQITGWPVLVLAAVGAWRVAVAGPFDRLRLVLGGWGVAFVVFVLVGALAPVDPGNVRYAAEFVNRVVLATYPAAAVLAAVGVAWAWRNGPVFQAAAGALAIAAFSLAARSWLAWLD
jgi:hypothetical protein